MRKGLIVTLGFIAVVSLAGFALTRCDSGYSLGDLDKINNAPIEGDNPTPPDQVVPTDKEPPTVVPTNEPPTDGWTPPPCVTPTPTPTPTPPACEPGVERVPYLCVASHGVSSAWLHLNSKLIFGPNSFHNDDWMKCRRIECIDGTNTIIAKIAGKPGDWLEFAVNEYDKCEDRFEPKEIYYNQIKREKGKPELETFTFEFDCSPEDIGR